MKKWIDRFGYAVLTPGIAAAVVWAVVSEPKLRLLLGDFARDVFLLVLIAMAAWAVGERLRRWLKEESSGLEGALWWPSVEPTSLWAVLTMATQSHKAQCSGGAMERAKDAS